MHNGQPPIDDVAPKTLPYDIEAERATLGSILLNRDAIVAVDGWLLPEYF